MILTTTLYGLDVAYLVVSGEPLLVLYCDPETGRWRAGWRPADYRSGSSSR